MRGCIVKVKEEFLHNKYLHKSFLYYVVRVVYIDKKWVCHVKPVSNNYPIKCDTLSIVQDHVEVVFGQANVLLARRINNLSKNI